MACGNNNISRGYLSSPPKPVTSSDIRALARGQIQRNSPFASPKGVRATERRAAKVAEEAVKQASRGREPAPLHQLRKGIDKNVTGPKRTHLLRQIDRLIAESEDKERRADQLRSSFRKDLSRNSSYGLGDVDRVMDSLGPAFDLMARRGVLGFDAADVGGRPVVSSSDFGRDTSKVVQRQGTAADRGPGARGIPAEVAVVRDLMSREVTARSPSGKTLSLSVADHDDVTMGTKFRTDSPARKTVEGDVVIHRDGRKIAIDNKYRRNGRLDLSDQLREELSGVVSAMAKGRVDQFVLSTNGKASKMVIELIGRENARLTTMVDSEVKRLSGLASEAKASGTHYTEALSLEDLSLYMRLVKGGSRPSIWLAEEVGEL